MVFGSSVDRILEFLARLELGRPAGGDGGDQVGLVHGGARRGD